MDWKLEVVVVPVTDVDRAKAFYADKFGFEVDVDSSPMEGVRIVQLTPPGSGCSIMVGKGMGEGEPGSLKGVQICVGDIEAAHAELVSRGVDCTPVRHLGPNGWEEGKGGDWNSFVFLEDPDGNSWAIQESPRIRKEMLAAAGASSGA
jgi:catechol 2,3-dioxygenase-like lactoylglutathione lyase family enzyme